MLTKLHVDVSSIKTDIDKNRHFWFVEYAEYFWYTILYEIPGIQANRKISIALLMEIYLNITLEKPS